MNSILIQTIQNKIDWLNFVIFDFKWVYFDFWSIVILWSGAILFTIISILKIKHRWQVLLSILALSQFFQTTNPNSIPEMHWIIKTINHINKLSIGMLGGYLMYAFFNWNNRRKYSLWLASLLSAITISFIWVGTYGYSYNISFFNSPAINWWAFTCWSVSGVIITAIYQLIKVRKNAVWAIVFTWSVYISILLLVEYLAFHIFTFQEATKGTKALIFDVIHGRPEMHVFYTTSTFIFISTYIVMSTIFRRYEREQHKSKLHI